MTSIFKRDWFGLLRFIIRRFIDQECQKTAAAMTYTTLFALVPLMTVAYSILSALPSTEGAGAGIQDLLFRNLLPESSQVVSNYLADFAQQARNLTFVGVGFLIITAILMMKSIERAFNRIWSVAEDRKGASSFLLYWSVLTLGPLLMGSGMAVTSFVVSHKLFLDATDTLGITAILLQFLPLLTSSVAFMMLFFFVPKTHVSLRHAWLGGIFTAVCFELAKWGFSHFVSLSPSYQVVYGAFAAVPLFLLWIYISWNILLLGATLVMALQRYRPNWHSANREPLIVALKVVQVLFDRWKSNKPLTINELQEMVSVLSARQQRKLLQVLQNQGLLVFVKNEASVKGWPSGYWQLGRDLSAMTQWQLLALMPWRVPPELLATETIDTKSPKGGFSLLSPSVINTLQDYLRQGESMLSRPAQTLFESEQA
ncbi:YihY family inner membrane protein [Oceanospirillum sp.]|uniref:YihY family inner membrane protein n=1 Tax=Oceanospirillum sp. TaxID=2021254 RepID=UPI003A95140A